MSKYHALRDQLRRKTTEVEYTLEELAAMVPGGLPRSAYKYEAWWTNGDQTHSQSKSWRDAGYEAHPNLAHGTVRFVPSQRRSH